MPNPEPPPLPPPVLPTRRCGGNQATRSAWLGAIVLGVAIIIGLIVLSDRGGPASPPSPQRGARSAATYTYLGRPVSQKWLDEMYERFAEKIALVDGTYVDTCKPTLDDYPRSFAPSQLWGFKVETIISESQAMLYREPMLPRRGPPLSNLPMLPECRLHLRGIDTAGLVDGQKVTEELIPKGIVRVGRYQYLDVIGSMRTIPSYAVPRELTRDQFADALRKGFKLVAYSRTGKHGDEAVARPIVGETASEGDPNGHSRQTSP